MRGLVFQHRHPLKSLCNYTKPTSKVPEFPKHPILFIDSSMTESIQDMSAKSNETARDANSERNIISKKRLSGGISEVEERSVQTVS